MEVNPDTLPVQSFMDDEPNRNFCKNLPMSNYDGEVKLDKVKTENLPIVIKKQEKSDFDQNMIL